MKLPKFAALVFLLCSSTQVLGQTVDSAFGFYPMHVGDVWEYHWGNYIADPPLHLYYQKNEILYDSTMPNGLKYFALQQTNIDTKYSTVSFQRIDSATGDVCMWCDSVDRGSYYNVRASASLPDTVFGVPTVYRGTGVMDSFTKLAYGFGIVAQTDYGSGWPNRSVIIYAKIDGVEFGTPLSVAKNSLQIATFHLAQNYPNPFNPSTTIRLSVPTRSRVRLTIFNLLGQQVAELANQEMNAGSYERTWNAIVASGLYFYRIEAVSVTDPGKRFVDVKKMVLVR